MTISESEIAEMKATSGQATGLQSRVVISGTQNWESDRSACKYGKFLTSLNLIFLMYKMPVKRPISRVWGRDKRDQDVRLLVHNR